MALLDTEGFGWTTNGPDLTTYGAFSITTGSMQLPIGTGGPLGDNYYAGERNLLSGMRRTPLSASVTTFFWGGRITAPPGGTAWPHFMYFDDPSGNEQFHLVISTGGVISVLNGNTTLGTASTPVSATPGNWNYLEVGAVIGGAGVGSVTVRVNNTVVLSLTGVNTQATGAGGVQSWVWGAQSFTNVSTWGLMHHYFCDNTGPAPNNTFLGDSRVQTLRAIANDAVQFTPPSGPFIATTGTAATSGAGASFSNTVNYQKMALNVGGILTQTDMILTAGITGNVKMAIYASNAAGTAPSGAPLATSAQVTNPVAGTVTFAFSGGLRLASGTSYWLAMLADVVTNWRGTTNGLANTASTQSQTYASGFPTTPAPGALQANQFYTDMVCTTQSNFDIAAASPPIPGTFFNSDSTVGDQDTFTCNAATGLLSVFGVNVKALALKSDVGTRSLQVVVKSGAATTQGVSTPLLTSAQQIRAIFASDPSTGAAWSVGLAPKPGYRVSA